MLVVDRRPLRLPGMLLALASDGISYFIVHGSHRGLWYAETELP